MLRLIERLLPPALHRLALRMAHRARHVWRKVAKPDLSGVSVILRDESGRVLLVRHSYGPGTWALPGGGLKPGEAPETCARREMREELAIELADLRLVDTFEETLSGARHTAHLFLARPEGIPSADRREIAEVRSFATGDLPKTLSPFARRRLALWLEQG